MYTDPTQQVYATFNGLGMPVGLKVSDALCAQGGEAVSLACSQAMLDGHTKSQNTSELIPNFHRDSSFLLNTYPLRH